MRFRLFGLAFLFCIPTLYAQDINYNFRNLSVKDGLSNSYINAIFQDSHGFLWFGTFNGADRYDGYNFIVFRNDVNDSSSIASSSVYTFFEDKGGTLWIGTNNGLSKFNPSTGRFINFRNKVSDPSSLSHNNVRTIIQDKNGTIWFGTYGGGIDKIDTLTGKFTRYKNIPSEPSSLISDKVNVLFIDSRNNFWVGTENGGISLFNPKKGTFRNFATDPQYPGLKNTGIINSIYEDKSGELWFCTWFEGLFRLNPATGEVINYRQQEDKPNSLSSNCIRSIIQDKDGNFWIATFGHGLERLDLNTKHILNFQHRQENLYSVSNDFVYSLGIDRMGILWIGTYGNGLNFIDISKEKFLRYDVSKGLSNNQVSALADMGNKELWIGTVGGGLNILNLRNNTFKTLSFKGEGYVNNIRALFKDHLGRVWIGTSDGLIRYDRHNRTYIYYKNNPENSNSIGYRSIYAIEEDKKGNIWLSVLGNGINVLPFRETLKNDPEAAVFIRHNIENAGLTEADINAIFRDSKNRIWIGADALYLFDEASGRYKKEIDENVNAIHEDKSGIFWLASTGNGLIKYNPVTKKRKIFTENEGLPNNTFYGLLEDKNNILWMSTDAGLVRFDKSAETFMNYTAGDGLQGDQFLGNSCTMLATGEMAFGGYNGFSLFNPDSLKPNKNVPEVVISSVKINDHIIKPGDLVNKRKILTKPIYLTREITLTHRENKVSFEFAVLSFDAPEKNIYRYKLEGFDNGWINTSADNRIATYTNLPGGQYIFRVQGSADGNDFKYSGIALKINVISPFWARWWFRVLAGLVIIGLMFIFYYFRIRSIKNQKRILERLIQQRTKDLQDANALLMEQHEEMQQQNEEINCQNENLKELSERILSQNRELELHQNQLESLVEERTKELEKEKNRAQESDRLKSAFLANMSHEIRTPMNAIVGFSSLLKEPDLSNEEKDEFIQLINNNSETLLVLIEDILDLSVIEANQIIIRQENINLDQFIEGIYASFALSRKNTNIEIKLKNHLKGNNIYFTSDKFRTKQILTNLMNNACKFTEKGYVELGVELRGSKLVFYVKDTGVGISDTDLNLIFERFRKIEKDRSAKYRGVGLGLSISKKLAELLGGDLIVESKLGEGTVFTCILPFIQAMAEEKEIVKQGLRKNNYIWNNRKILVVEDEKANYLFLLKILEKTKAGVMWADNGLQAVNLIEEGNSYDVILMDIKLPKMNGDEAMQIIRSIVPDQVIIAQTAYSWPEDETRIRNAGFNDYISKPINPEALLSIIDKYLNKKR